MKRSWLILSLMLAIILSTIVPVLASTPVLPPINNNRLLKQSFQLNQIIPRASKQEYGNVTVYSTVGKANQNNIMRWSVVPDLWAYIFVQGMGWWWVENIPKKFTVIMVSESEFKQLWPQAADEDKAIYVHPNEIWTKGYTIYDSTIIHEYLHKILSWIYAPSPIFSNTRLPGYSPLIINGGEIVANKLNQELGSNPNPMVIDPIRFNRMWKITKALMGGQGFIGVENTPAPLIVDCRQNCSWRIIDINVREFEGWQNYNDTGEIYLAITMLAAILDHYNQHRDNTGIFSLAVCNAKKLLNQQIGRNPGENSFIFFQGQLISCE